MPFNLLSLAEASAHTGLSETELKTAAANGEIETVNRDSGIYFLETALNRFMAGAAGRRSEKVHPVFDEETLTEEKTYSEALVFGGGEDEDD